MPFPKFLLLLIPLLTAASDNDVVKVYDEAMSLVVNNHISGEAKKDVFAKRVMEGRATLVTPGSTAQLTDVANAVLRGLGTSHTQLYSDADQEYWVLKAAFAGEIETPAFETSCAWFRRSGKRWYANIVPEGSPAALAGLKRGDEIITANGLPFEPINSFLGQTQVRLQVKRLAWDKGTEMVVTPIKKSLHRCLLDGSAASGKIYVHNGKRIAYFHLMSGTHPSFRVALEEAVGRLGPTSDAFVLDLRDGMGGADPGFIDLFLKRDRPQHFNKAMVVLINDRSRSGKEWLAYLLKKMGRARLIGERTAGAFLGAKLFSLASPQYALYLAVQPGPDLQGVQLEGVGVEPDEMVKDSLVYAGGADPVMDKGLEVASQLK